MTMLPFYQTYLKNSGIPHFESNITLKYRNFDKTANSLVIT